MGLRQLQAFDLEQVDLVLVQHLVVGLLVPDQREQRHDLLIVPVLVLLLQVLLVLGQVSDLLVLDHDQLGLQHHLGLLGLLRHDQQELLHHVQQELLLHVQQELHHLFQQGLLLLLYLLELLHLLCQQVLLLHLFLQVLLLFLRVQLHLLFQRLHHLYLVLLHPFQLEQLLLYQLGLDLVLQVLADLLVLLDLQVLLSEVQPELQALVLGQLQAVVVVGEQLALQELLPVEELVVLLAWALVQGQGLGLGLGQELGLGSRWELAVLLHLLVHFVAMI